MFSDKWINILNEVESFHGGITLYGLEVKIMKSIR